jgi:hypothetical protein
MYNETIKQQQLTSHDAQDQGQQLQQVWLAGGSSV